MQEHRNEITNIFMKLVFLDIIDTKNQRGTNKIIFQANCLNLFQKVMFMLVKISIIEEKGTKFIPLSYNLLSKGKGNRVTVITQTI